MAAELAEFSKGWIHFNPHPGQARAWQSERRFVCVIAGTQGGKTSFGPHWLAREIQRCGPGDYIVATPTFQLLDKKALPELKKLFERWLRLGRYIGSPSRRFVFSPDGERATFGHASPDVPTQILFGYADDPESLESATAKAAWLDEVGQKRFRLSSWEAILRRLSLAQGRALMTTTPYDLGWLKQQVYNRWQAGDPDYDVIRFDSTENPQFPPEEFERARRTLPRWKFDLFYRAIFTRPAGMIYDNFKDEAAPEGHLIPRFPIPTTWPRFVGLDFGTVNTAAMFLAQEQSQEGVPSGHYIGYRTYHTGGRTAAQHAEAILHGEPRTPVCVGGAASEDDWRAEFRAAGLPVQEPPIREVEVGIDRVYAAHADNLILVFDDLAEYLAEKLSYSREVDENGEPTEKIEDKHSYHIMDAERYIVSKLRTVAAHPMAIAVGTGIETALVTPPAQPDTVPITTQHLPVATPRKPPQEWWKQGRR